ncbi:MAG TPA: response regulator [Candidatus Latescibacteria bacterium]|nr:response regulator [Candidatus Latescibacterota bacterium]
MAQIRVLVCDDEPDARFLLRSRLVSLGYDVLEASDGDECVKIAASDPVDIIILDVSMPRVDGFSACSELRRNPRTRHIPIVFLTALRTSRDDRLKGLRLGADEYLVKDVDPEELAARLEAVLRRTVGAVETNPLTHLPGNAVVTEEIESRIRKREPFAVAWADLDNFSAFNDRYGFARGDKLIVETATILLESLKLFGSEEDFLGHLGGDDFVVVSTVERSAMMAEHAVKLGRERLPLLYDLDDRSRGYVRTLDRNGKQLQYPITNISVAIVQSRGQRFQNILQVADAANEMKRRAKMNPGSGVVIDRRVH